MPTVVIADDSPTLRRIVTSVLTKEGYEVVVAEDGVEAVQAVFRTMPDACVFDVQMPRVSGYVAARVVKDDWQTADIPIILLTSLDAASDRYWGKQVGADRYLSKDFEAPELAEAVAEVLAEKAKARGGAPNLKADPVELGQDDVLQRVCDILDRKLFETSRAGRGHRLAGGALSFEATIEELLKQLQRFVDYDLCSVLIPEERVAYVGVAHETAVSHYDEFLDAAAGSASAEATGVQPAGRAARRPRRRPRRAARRGRRLDPDGDLPVDAAARSWRQGRRPAGPVQSRPRTPSARPRCRPSS